MPDSNHIFWECVQMAVIGIVMIAFCGLAYNNTINATDFLMISTTLLGSFLARRIGKQNNG